MSVTSRTPRSRGGRSSSDHSRSRSSRDEVVQRTGDEGLSRQERKQRTRQALLDAALARLEDHSFGALSLREVAREAGITPTAFYRHFESMEDLGLVLVDESFRSLREMLRAGRSEVAAPGDEIRASVAILVRHVHEHRAHFRFIARERSGGSAGLRTAIRHEIRLFSSELATDLARYPILRDLPTADLQMIASLIVAMMVSAVESILDAPLDRPEVEAEIRATAEQQMRLIVLGALQWRAG